MSEVMATSSGRARDHELNCVCRQSCAVQLGTAIQWCRRHTVSKENPADGDSRLADGGFLRAGERFVGDQLRRHLGARAPACRDAFAPMRRRGDFSRSVWRFLPAHRCLAGGGVARRGANSHLFRRRVRFAPTTLGRIRAGLIWCVWIATLFCTFDSVATAGLNKGEEKARVADVFEQFIGDTDNLTYLTWAIT